MDVVKTGLYEKNKEALQEMLDKLEEAQNLLNRCYADALKEAERLRAEAYDVVKLEAHLDREKIVALLKKVDKFLGIEINYEIPKEQGQIDSEKAINLAGTPVEELHISARALNCLHRANVTTVLDLLLLSEDDLLRVRNMGEKSIEEVIKALAAHGLSLSPNK